MTIFLNQQIKEIQSQSISQMLIELNINHLGIAIAVNQVVISHSKWAEYLLAENDKVTIIRATQGG